MDIRSAMTLFIALILAPAIAECQQDSIPPVNIDKTSTAESAQNAPERSAATAGALAVAVAQDEKPGKPERPKKVEMDTNYDGRVDRIEVYDSEGRVARLDIDTNGDGNFDEWMVFEKGKPRMKGKDRNEDGKTDTWIEY